MTSTHFADRASAANSASRSTSRDTSPCPVMGLLLLFPRASSPRPALSARDLPGTDPGAADLIAETSSKVGYASDTGEFWGSIDKLSGQMTFDSQSPACVQVAVSVKPEPTDDQALEVRRVSMMLAAHEFRRLPGANAAGGDGIIACTLKLDGVERQVRIPISFAIDGPMLQGQGHFKVDLADFDVTPRPLGLTAGDDITMEVYLIATTQ